ncbi:MAG TPA: PH domain-containing protein [Bellilinea sp.]|nr:PH domain-containing protein [Bellilinea sp.]
MATGLPVTFLPPRRRALLLHILAAIGFLAVSAVSLILALQQQVSGIFSLLLLLSVAFFIPLPVVLYRAYALYNAAYTLERDGLRIRWGLRAEDIPLTEIEWVRPVTDLGFQLPLPRLSFPGAILGLRKIEELGEVEFLASDAASMLLIAVPKKVYAISPEDRRSFMRAFQNAIEMGSLSPLPAYSAEPAAFARRVWDDRVARGFLVAGLVLTVALLLLVSLMIPGRSQVALGFNNQGLPLEPVPAQQLLLLPVLGIFAYVADLFIGLFFYRREAERPVAFLLWISSAITPALLILAVLFIL